MANTKSGKRKAATLYRLSLVTSAAALSIAPALAAEDSDAERVRSDVIIVTARKQAEALDKTAAPVSVVRGHALVEGGILTPDQLAERFVGLTVLPNATGNLLFIRGVGGFTLTANAEPAVGWNYDGVFVTRPMGTFGQMFDLDRVELLKGPQGALHGRNASGGTVNLIPRKPKAGETEAFAAASFGNYNAFIGEAMINLPMGEQGAFRVSAQATGQDNYLRGLNDGPSQLGLRVQMASELTPGVSIRVAGDYTHLGGVGLGTSYLGKYVLKRATGQFTYTPSGLDPVSSTRSAEGQAFRRTIFLPTLGRNIDSLSSEPGQDHDFYGAHVEVEADLGFAQLSLLPSWRFADILGTPPGAPFEYLHRETQEQSSLEARLAGKSGAFDWLVGSYLYRENVKVDYAQSFANSLSFQEQGYRTNSKSGFAQASFNLSPKVRLGGGIRITGERKRNIANNTTFTITCPRLVGGIPSCPTVPLLPLFDRVSAISIPVPAPGQSPVPVLLNGVATGAVIGRSAASTDNRVKDSSVTWRGTVEADVGQTGLLYASIANGLRPGGTNAATGYETYLPEKLIAYTLGARWRHPQNWFDASLELFWWDYTNQHITSLQPDLSSPPRNAQITRNIGRSRIRGIDLEVDFRPAPLTNGYAKVEYLDSQYLDYSFPQVSAASVPLTGCLSARVGTSTTYTVDCADQRPFVSPKWTLTFGLRQGFDLGAFQLSLMARTRYVSGFMAGSAFLPEQYVRGYWTTHAQLMLADKTGRYELGAFVRNIEGNRTPTLINIHPTTNAPVASTTAPRTYGVRMSAKF